MGVFYLGTKPTAVKLPQLCGGWFGWVGSKCEGFVTLDVT